MPRQFLFLFKTEIQFIFIMADDLECETLILYLHYRDACTGGLDGLIGFGQEK